MAVKWLLEHKRSGDNAPRIILCRLVDSFSLLTKLFSRILYATVLIHSLFYLSHVVVLLPSLQEKHSTGTLLIMSCHIKKYH